MCEQIDLQYQDQFAKTRELEDEVKENQRIINQMRSDIQNKKKSLKTYEGILKTPNIENTEHKIAQKCRICHKLFANNEYLVTHYKRRHLDFYMAEIRPKEDEMLKHEVGEIALEMNKKNQIIDQEAIIQQIKDEVVDKFNSNLVSLQHEVQNIRKNESAQISSIIDKTQKSQPLQAEKIALAVKEYESTLKDMGKQMQNQI